MLATDCELHCPTTSSTHARSAPITCVLGFLQEKGKAEREKVGRERSLSECLVVVTDNVCVCARARACVHVCVCACVCVRMRVRARV